MEKNIEINGLNLCYEESGNPQGEPVIILHGWGCDHTTVRFIASILEKNMRVINVDLPGHGKSDEPPAVWGSNDFADCIISFAKELELTNPSLIGHSFGGRTSILVATKYPVKKLVLVDSAGITPRRSICYYYKIYTYKAGKNLLPILLGKKKGGEILEKIKAKRGSADYNASTPMMRAVMSKCINEDLREKFPAIKAPTLLIWGENDTATPLSDAWIMEKKIPDCGLVVFSGCGHYSFLDNPLGFKSVMAEFFKEELSDKSLSSKYK